MKLKRILLIDDDPEDQYLFSLALADINYGTHLKIYSNGIEAVKHLGNPARYEMIFLDLHMPLMDGVQCLKLIIKHESYKRIPVIIMTTSVDGRQLDECKQLGAAGIFHKPNTYRELCTDLEKILSAY